jgi:hypothetical protein
MVPEIAVLFSTREHWGVFTNHRLQVRVRFYPNVFALTQGRLGSVSVGSVLRRLKSLRESKLAAPAAC